MAKLTNETGNTGELRVKSFRADDETFEKFKVLANDEFGNQGQCLAALINLYETEKSKTSIIERKLEIDSFQTHINKIGELFLMSLQLNQDAEERIRAEFERLLDSKENTIIDLQSKVSDLTATKQSQEETVKEVKGENRELFTKNIEFEKNIDKQNKDYAAALADKDNLNKALTDSCNERKLEIETLKADAAGTVEKLKTLNAIEAQNKKLAIEVSNLAAEIEKQKEIAELEKEKALIAAEKIHQQELKEAHAQHYEETKEYRSQHDRELNEFKAEIKELQKRIKELESKKPTTTAAKPEKTTTK